MKRVPLMVLLRAYIQAHALTRKSELHYGAVARRFERWLGRPAFLRDVAALGDAYVAFRVEGGTIGHEPIAASKTTAAGHRAVLATLMRFAVERKWCRRVTLRPIRKPLVIPNALLLEEIDRLLAHATPRQRAAIMLAYDTGFRRSDIFLCRWGETFDRGADRLIAHVASKTGRVEVRRLRPDTVAACQAIRKPGDDRMVPGPRSVSNWTARWQHLGARAGVNVRRRGLQAVRRSGASYLASKGIDPKRYLGHSTDGLAERHYIDPRISSDVPDLPPISDRPPPSPPPIDP